MTTSPSNPDPREGRPDRPQAGAPLDLDEPDDRDAPDEAGRTEPDPDSVWARYRDPSVRNYLFAGLAALAMVFVVLFQQGSDVGGLLLVILGVAGLALRWTFTPPFFVLLLTYFLVFPLGVPDPGTASRFELIHGRFRVTDLILVFSAVVFLACQYRVLGLVHQAVPFDTNLPRKGEEPTRRPPALIPPGEITRLLWLTGAVVLAGQFAWYFVTSAEVVPGEVFPLRLVDAADRNRAGAREGLPERATRFVVLAGLVFFPALLARVVFGYWRLKAMGPAEGRMVMQDAAWNEVRREHVRVEKWRVWGRRRAAERAKKAAGTQPEGKR
jgi:hypothetical protein